MCSSLNSNERLEDGYRFDWAKRKCIACVIRHAVQVKVLMHSTPTAHSHQRFVDQPVT